MPRRSSLGGIADSQAWLRGWVHPVVSDAIYAEYERVLRQVKTQEGFDTDTEPWLDTLRSSALWVTPTPLREPVGRDRHDDKFIEAALAAGARTLIARCSCASSRRFAIVRSVPASES